jgi:hypothetical protein
LSHGSTSIGRCSVCKHHTLHPSSKCHLIMSDITNRTTSILRELSSQRDFFGGSVLARYRDIPLIEDFLQQIQEAKADLGIKFQHHISPNSRDPKDLESRITAHEVLTTNLKRVVNKLKEREALSSRRKLMENLAEFEILRNHTLPVTEEQRATMRGKEVVQDREVAALAESARRVFASEPRKDNDMEDVDMGDPDDSPNTRQNPHNERQVASPARQHTANQADKHQRIASDTGSFGANART